MATVRITKDLTRDIINRLASQFEVRLDAVKKNITDGFEPMIPQYREDLLAVILEQHNMPRETYDAIPDGWCHRTKTLRASQINGVSMHLIGSVRFAEEIKIPEELHYRNEMRRMEHPLLQQYAEYASIANAQVSQLEREKREAVAEANHLLKQCGSLKQALDAWPHLMELLPAWAIKQHNQPTEKRAKNVVTSVDTDKLTCAVVAGKLAVAVLDR
jgi:hypothetical protein